MGWITAIVAIGGAVANKQKQNSANKKATLIANKQQQIGDDQYNQYSSIVAPRYKQLVAEAFDQSKTPTAEAARAGAQATATADNAEQITLRNARKAGINTSSPAFAGINRENQAARMGLISGAKTYARRTAAETNLANQSALVNQGQGMLTNAVAANNSAYNMQSELAAQKSSQDIAQGQLYGQAAGYLGGALKGYLTKTPATTGNAGTWGSNTGGVTDSLGGSLTKKYKFGT
jgi:hypothetical protein